MRIAASSVQSFHAQAIPPQQLLGSPKCENQSSRQACLLCQTSQYDAFHTLVCLTKWESASSRPPLNVQVGMQAGVMAKCQWQVAEGTVARCMARAGVAGVGVEVGASHKVADFSIAGCTIAAGLQVKPKQTLLPQPAADDHHKHGSSWLDGRVLVSIGMMLLVGNFVRLMSVCA